MNKKQYLNELASYLNEKDVIREDIESIISDYEELYDESADRGLTDDEIYEKLGSPRFIYTSLKDTLKKKSNSKEYSKIIAIMPFISTILFFLIGSGLGHYEYAWMVFLLIPVVAIIINVKGKDKFIALSPFVSVVVFLLIGLLVNVWHPTWLILLLIPVMAILLKTPAKPRIVAILPFVITIIYFLVAEFVYFDFYKIGYAMFALIPIVAILFEPLNIKRIILLTSIVLAAIAHLLLSLYFGYWDYAWLAYLVPIGLSILFGDILIRWGTKNTRLNLIIGIIISAIYLAVSIIIGDIWSWSWIILLLIPMVSIFIQERFKNPVAYMPFISTIIFIALGFFANLWAWSWMVYLLIPIVAILTSKKNENKIERTNMLDEDE